jgi:hypothetical protein
MYSMEYDTSTNLYQIRVKKPRTAENTTDILSKIAKVISPIYIGEDLAEYIKKFEPPTREDRLGRAIDKEDTNLLKEVFTDSTLIDAVYCPCKVKLIFKYLLPEDVSFLFNFGLIYDYDIDIKRRKDTEETFEVTLREND